MFKFKFIKFQIIFKNNIIAVGSFTQGVEISLLIEFDIGNASGKGILQLLFIQV